MTGRLYYDTFYPNELVIGAYFSRLKPLAQSLDNNAKLRFQSCCKGFPACRPLLRCSYKINMAIAIGPWERK